MTTEQEKFWQSSFGNEYTKRNTLSNDEYDALYQKRFGKTRSEMNKEFLADLSFDSILEVGCNMGAQLALLESTGYKNLHGIDINAGAVSEAKKRLPDATITEGSAFELPYENACFDLIFTSGVLIHIHPDDLPRIMSEIYRVSRRFIWGFEYFAQTHQEIPYRGNTGRLWKGDFAKIYLEQFPHLKLVKEKRYPYLNEELEDSMFLLEKEN